MTGPSPEAAAGTDLPAERDHRAFYQRYRPRKFAEVVGQEAIVQTLRNAVARDAVGHAYLLCGPRGTGKTSIARILYRALNCLRPDEGEPCGECASCQAVDAGRAVDLIEMDAASHGGIDDVREIRERVYFAPVEAKVKVYIVDEAHQLSSRAWDAFLKTIEEPPPRTVFVLATTEAHRVPATIVSRCQRFDLRRATQRQLQQHLTAIAASERINLESGVAERLARLARGSFRDALSMLDQLAAFGGARITMESARAILGLARGDALRSYLDALSTGDAARALQLLEDVSDEGADLRQFLDEVVFYLRGALLVRAGAAPAVAGHFGQEERQWLGELAQRWAPGQLVAVLKALGEIESRGRDEQQVLVRAELATTWAADLVHSPPPAAQAAGGGAGHGSGGEGPIAHPEPAPAAAAWELRPPPHLPEPGPAGSWLEARPTPGRPGSTTAPTARASDAEASPAALAPTEGAPAPEALAVAATERSGGGAQSAEPAPPSLASLQAHWPTIVARFQGNLLAKMVLPQLAPSRLDGEVLTLAGPIGDLERQRLDTTETRTAVEALIREVAGAAVRVRFDQTERPAPMAPDAPAPSGSLAEFGAALFGGRLVSDASDEGV